MQLQLQTPKSPLFPDMLWSKPENKHQAGKLLIIGGNSFGFSAVGEAYDQALKAGVGEVRVLLPNVIQKFAGGVFEHAIFAATNPSGSFSKDALSTCLEAAEWADAVLIIGNVSRNAETATMLELFYEAYKGVLIVTKDALELALKNSSGLAKRKKTALVLTMADLQLLAKQCKFQEPLTFEVNNEVFAQRLLLLSNEIDASLLVKRNDLIYVLEKNKINATITKSEDKIWRAKSATLASVWLLQNPDKSFEALTTSLVI